MNETIIVGVSGGIDSALSALRLAEQGWNVRAVHLLMHGERDEHDLARLRMIERLLEQPVLRLDCRSRFKSDVIAPFVEAYRRGETPNPCVICNAVLKFRALLETADALGARYVATGHYVRIVHSGGSAAIARSAAKKDQSYMLCRLPAEWLSRLVFPLADERDKAHVRARLAARLGVEAASGRESQDICFLEGTSLEDFLTSRIPPQERCPGRMVDENGHDLGPHKGLIFYTEGQRKGLGLSCGPWFVAGRDFSGGVLRLSHGRETTVSEVSFDRAVWQRQPVLSRRCQVKYCYRFAAVDARLTECGDGRGAIRLDVPARGVSLGQSLAFYDGDILLGGGVITGMR